MIVPSAWPQVLDFFGTPLVIEPWPGQLLQPRGLLPVRQFVRRLGLTRALGQALDDPRDADLSRVLLSRASAQTSWQQFGNNIGDVSPTWLQCHWQKSGDVTACQKSTLTVSPTCFQRHADGRRAGLKIRFVCQQVERLPSPNASRVLRGLQGDKGVSQAHEMIVPGRTSASQPRLEHSGAAGSRSAQAGLPSASLAGPPAGSPLRRD